MLALSVVIVAELATALKDTELGLSQRISALLPSSNLGPIMRRVKLNTASSASSALVWLAECGFHFSPSRLVSHFGTKEKPRLLQLQISRIGSNSPKLISPGTKYDLFPSAQNITKAAETKLFLLARKTKSIQLLPARSLLICPNEFGLIFSFAHWPRVKLGLIISVAPLELFCFIPSADCTI